MKILTWAITLAAVGILTFFLISNSNNHDLDVDILSIFENKIVYTTDANADVDRLMRHCSQAGGTFNSCGSVCEDDSEICVTSCAFTCEF